MIIKNITWNLSSSFLPLIIGLVTFPLLIANYGLERFGLLSIAWSVVGYFSLFDMGLSRALTQLVAKMLHQKEEDFYSSPVLYTALIMMWVLGVFGGICLWLVTPWLIQHGLSVTAALRDEAINAFGILAISIPFVVHTSALKGVMDALHLFKQSSLIKMLLGILTFAGPYLASCFNQSLTYAAISLVMIRLLIWLLHWWVINQQPLLQFAKRRFQFNSLKPLFAFGGWLSVSNIVGPLMVYLDRFVIASILGAAVVSYYVAPYEVISKLWVIPAAISGVLFPLFAQFWQSEPERSTLLLQKGIAYTLILLYPATLLLAVTADFWLFAWLNQDFALKSHAIVQWLAAGVLINSVAQILYANVQGAGKSDWTAKLHLVEVLPYLLSLYILLKVFGIEGAAIAWFLRVTFDFAGLSWLIVKLKPDLSLSIKSIFGITVMATGSIIATVFTNNFYALLTLTALSLVLYSYLSISRLQHDNFWPFKISN